MKNYLIILNTCRKEHLTDKAVGRIKRGHCKVLSMVSGT